MSLRDLVDADCGGANPLVRLGSHFMRDAAYKDQGLGGGGHHQPGPSYVNRPTGQFDGDQLVNEFLGQIAAVPPQTFRMDALLQEMREIDAHQFHPQVVRAPPVIDEVAASGRGAAAWANEFSTSKSSDQFGVTTNDNLHSIWQQSGDPMASQMAQQQQANLYANEFFQNFGQQPAMAEQQFMPPPSSNAIPLAAGGVLQSMTYDPDQHKYTEFMQFMRNVSDGGVRIENGQVMAEAEEFFAAHKRQAEVAEGIDTVDWVKDFEAGKQGESETTDNYNSQFWNRLQNEWKKISEEDDLGHPWLSELNDYYEPYKEYVFDEENPMTDLENAFEKGKAFLAQGDIPSAVLCFESAVKQDPDNAEGWQLLGTSQAENEKDPNAIPALRRALELSPNNATVMMALAVSYTNESLQNLALKMLVEWLKCNGEYKQIIPESLMRSSDAGAEEAAAGASSIIRGPELKEVQELYLRAVQQRQPAIDADIQEALGVLFNLSSEYDKAADCYRAALHVRPDSAKTWNRLGASYANGNRSVEAVDAYTRALQIQPGFIRARYNVGIICINLKAYKEAAEHFLTALNHQATSMERSGLSRTNPAHSMSETIWSTLRMAISLMHRSDLQPALDNRDLKKLNEEFAAMGGDDSGGGGGGGSDAADPTQ